MRISEEDGGNPDEIDAHEHGRLLSARVVSLFTRCDDRGTFPRRHQADMGQIPKMAGERILTSG